MPLKIPTLISMTKKDLFHAIADYLEQYGWVQGAYLEPQGACIYGACYRVLSESDTPVIVRNQLVRAHYLRWLQDFALWLGLDPAVENPIGEVIDLVHWNDAEDRTKEEVILNLRKFVEEMC